MKLSPKKGFYGMVAVLIVVIVLAGGGIYLLMQQIESKQTDLAKTEGEEIFINEQIRQIAQAQTRLAEFKEDGTLTKLDRLLPSAKNQSEVVAILDKLAADNGLDASSYTFTSNASSLPDELSLLEPSGTVNGTLVMPINFTVKGPYNGILSFLEDIENNEKIIFVNTMNITPNGEEFTTQLEIKFYFQPETP